MKKLLLLIFVMPLASYSQDNTVRIKRSIMSSMSISYPLKDTMLAGIENKLQIVLDAPYKLENVVIDSKGAELIKKDDGTFALKTEGTDPVTITVYMNNRSLGQRTYTPMKISESMSVRLKRIMEQ
jgi:hypothetical protein